MKWQPNQRVLVESSNSSNTKEHANRHLHISRIVPSSNWLRGESGCLTDKLSYATYFRKENIYRLQTLIWKVRMYHGRGWHQRTGVTSNNLCSRARSAAYHGGT